MIDSIDVSERLFLLMTTNVQAACDVHRSGHFALSKTETVPVTSKTSSLKRWG